MQDLTPGLGEIAALLGRGTEYRGKLTFEGRVRVDGRFEGEVYSEGILIVGEGAEIDATIDVGTLIVLGGVVRGTIHARELVELHTHARVHADIETARIFVGEGAHFDGRCQMRGGGQPERHAMDTPKIEEPSTAEDSTEDAGAAEESTEETGPPTEDTSAVNADEEPTVETTAPEAAADDGDGEPSASAGRARTKAAEAE